MLLDRIKELNNTINVIKKDELIMLRKLSETMNATVTLVKNDDYLLSIYIGGTDTDIMIKLNGDAVVSTDFINAGELLDILNTITITLEGE